MQCYAYTFITCCVVLCICMFVSVDRGGLGWVGFGGIFCYCCCILLPSRNEEQFRCYIVLILYPFFPMFRFAPSTEKKKIIFRCTATLLLPSCCCVYVMAWHTHTTVLEKEKIEKQQKTGKARKRERESERSNECGRENERSPSSNKLRLYVSGYVELCVYMSVSMWLCMAFVFVCMVEAAMWRFIAQFASSNYVGGGCCLKVLAIINC